MTHPLVTEVRSRLRQAANPARAAEMQRYAKSAMPFRGVAAPAQRLIWRAVFSAHPLGSFAEWQAVALELWRDAAYREERYAAIALTDLKAYAPYRTIAAVPMLEEMIVTGAWWDLVDSLATHHLGDVLRAELAAGRGARMRALLLRWARGRNLWKRRAAILSQIRFKSETDLELLYACLEPSLLPQPAFARLRRASPPNRLRQGYGGRNGISGTISSFASRLDGHSDGTPGPTPPKCGATCQLTAIG